MGQSNIIFFFLLAGFVVYITMKGELADYISVLTGGAPVTAASSSGGSGGAVAAPGAGSVASDVNAIAQGMQGSGLLSGSSGDPFSGSGSDTLGGATDNLDSFFEGG